jgi:hypothetical protein
MRARFPAVVDTYMRKVVPPVIVPNGLVESYMAREEAKFNQEIERTVAEKRIGKRRELAMENGLELTPGGEYINIDLHVHMRPQGDSVEEEEEEEEEEDTSDEDYEPEAEEAKHSLRPPTEGGKSYYHGEKTDRDKANDIEREINLLVQGLRRSMRKKWENDKELRAEAFREREGQPTDSHWTATGCPTDALHHNSVHRKKKKMPENARKLVFIIMLARWACAISSKCVPELLQLAVVVREHDAVQRCTGRSRCERHH